METQENKKTGKQHLDESDKKNLKLGVEKRESQIKDNEIIRKHYGI